MDDVVTRCTPAAGCCEAIRASEITSRTPVGPRWSSSRPTSQSHAPCRCAATRSAWTVGSSAVHLPEIEEYLHYRSIDVSTIKELARRWYPDEMGGLTKRASAHRAMDDIKESVAELELLARAPSSAQTAPTSPQAPSRPLSDGDATAPPEGARPAVREDTACLRRGVGRGRTRRAAHPDPDHVAGPGSRELLRARGRRGVTLVDPGLPDPASNAALVAAPRRRRDPRRARPHRAGHPLPPRPLRWRRAAQGRAPLRRGRTRRLRHTLRPAAGRHRTDRAAGPSRGRPIRTSAR